MANYYTLLTNYGQSFIANAQASTQLALTHVVLGDANNQPYLPESRINSTALVNQRAKLPVTSVKVTNPTTAEVTVVVPSNVGGWNLHEVGITDSSGKLVYVGNFHGGYRPTLTEGAGGDMELIFTIKSNNLATVVIEVENQVVAATRGWVSDTFTPLTHISDPNPHNQYVLISTFNLHVVQNTKDHKAITDWQSNHTTTPDPHPQYTVKENNDQELEAIKSNISKLLLRQAFKVGDIYTTTLLHANSDEVRDHHGYGTWERFAEGRTLVGFSTKTADPANYKTIGNEFGENTHQLVFGEMPEHKHPSGVGLPETGSLGGAIRGTVVIYDQDGTPVTGTPNTTQSVVSSDTDSTREGQTAPAGGGKPHNNVQPSTVVAYWKRTA